MMASEVKSPGAAKPRPDLRKRLSKLRVLLADRDVRTAGLVQGILQNFGFTRIEIVTNGEDALRELRSQPYDLIITEWNMHPVDGLTLVRAIRTAKDDARLRRDIPILMLTANAEAENVAAARDIGITEFVRKPFSARTISNRIIQIIENPRVFVKSPGYVGPCRRRREGAPNGEERRANRKKSGGPTTPENVQILPANDSLKQRLEGAKASDIINDEVIAEAQMELAKATGDFISWAGDDLRRLEAAYATLAADVEDTAAQHALRDAAYCIKSQAGIFGFEIGTEVAGLLVNFLNSHALTTQENLTIVRKHIDAITVIFSQQLKTSREAIGVELIASLQKLIAKLG